MIRECFICKRKLKEGEGVEEVCTSNCGVDVIIFCNKCHNSEYGN